MKPEQLVAVIQSGFLPEMKFGFDRPLSPKDCSSHTEKALEAFDSAMKFDFPQDRDVLQAIVAPLLLLCGEHSESGLWTSSETIGQSFRVLQLLKTTYKCTSIFQLFLLEREEGLVIKSGEVLKWSMELLSRKLSKEEYKKYPAALNCFIWILHHFTFPNLGTHLQEFLPFALTFCDDWETASKVRGLHCLDHITNNVTSTDLKWFGRAELLNSVFYKMLHSREVEILNALIPIYVQFLIKSESKQIDKVTMKILQDMEVESSVDLKRVYAQNFDGIIQLQGSKMMKWTSRYVRMLSSFMSIFDPERNPWQILMLKNTTLVIEIVGSRIKPYVLDLMKILTRLLYETSNKCLDQNDISMKECVGCLSTLRKICPDEFDFYADGLEFQQINSAFDSSWKMICTE